MKKEDLGIVLIIIFGVIFTISISFLAFEIVFHMGSLDEEVTLAEVVYVDEQIIIIYFEDNYYAQHYSKWDYEEKTIYLIPNIKSIEVIKVTYYPGYALFGFGKKEERLHYDWMLIDYDDGYSYGYEDGDHNEK